MKRSVFYAALAAAFFIFSIAGCNNQAKEPKEEEEVTQESTFDLSTAKQEIVDANKEYSRAFAAGDSAGVANLYTEDAKFMVSGAPAVKGRDNIQSTMANFRNSGITRVDLKTIDVWGSEGLVTEEGEFTIYNKDKDTVDKGKYLVLWKKKDGEWKLFRDIFNSDLSTENSD